MKNICLVILATKKTEELNALANQQYGSRASKSSGIKALNTCLFYDLIRLKIVPATSNVSDIK